MTLEPRLVDVTVPDEATGVVLVLHGGASRRGDMRVSPTQLSVLRMIPIASRVARAGRGRLAVFRLLNARRGWDTTHTPVHDVQWALGEVERRLGTAYPTCLVGHSLGGRAALLSAAHPDVVSVAALAPWVYPDDAPRGSLDDRRILIVHGTEDRIASHDRAAAVAASLARRADVTFVSVAGGKHAMLRHHDEFDGLAAEFAAVTLLGEEPTGTLALAAAGEHRIEV